MLEKRIDQRFAVFLALSIIIHAIIVSGVFLSKGQDSLFKGLGYGISNAPIMVDIMDAPPIKGRVTARALPKSPLNKTSPAQDAGKGARAPVGMKSMVPAIEGDSPPIRAIKEDAHAADKLPQKEASNHDAVKAQGNIHAGVKRPNLLPAQERLAELAKRYEEEAVAHEKGKTLQLNTSELKYRDYILDVKQRVEFFWEYPLSAVKNNWQGRLKIDFSINKDGTIKDIQLVKSSSYPSLDDAAITALRLSSPFPPFPDSFSIEDLSIHGSFEYLIYR